ncbi:MAG: DUF2142 domain-containing protein [Anaerolineae bacterium]|nr:DUF2142 domain-containing protein [Anaerolineae bacterium]
MGSKAPFLTVVVAFLVLGTLYALYTPPWQAPDEPAHYNYIAFLVREGRLPVLEMGDYPHLYLEEIKSRRFPPEMSIEPIRYEFHQPPLYYLLASPVYALTGGNLIALRLLSMAIGAGVVTVAFLIVRELLPEKPELAVGAAAFAAFVPMHIAISASVNNDALAELFIGLFLLETVRLIKEGFPEKALWRPSLFIALGFLTKTTAYISFVLYPVIFAVYAYRRISWSRGVRSFVLSLWPLLFTLPWFVRNMAVYGPSDPFGLSRHDAVVVGQPRTMEWVESMGIWSVLRAFLLTSFRSFWGQFGWMAVPMDERIYALLFLASFLALWGLLLWLPRGWRELKEFQHLGFILLALSFAFTALSFIWYNLKFVQHQGRYLFPALIPIGFGFSLGLREGLRRRAMAGAGLIFILLAFALVLKGFLTSDWNRFTLAIALLGAVGCGIKALLPERWDHFFFGLFFAGLAALSALCPFIYIKPYL